MEDAKKNWKTQKKRLEHIEDAKNSIDEAKQQATDQIQNLEEIKLDVQEQAKEVVKEQIKETIVAVIDDASNNAV